MNICHFRCGALLAMLAGVGHASAAGVAEQPSTLDVIHRMTTVTVERTAIEDLFGARVEVIKGNGYWTFHEGRGPVLADGMTITKFGYMTKNDGSAAPSVYMDIVGRCLELEQVRTAYPDLFTQNPVPSPHGGGVGYRSINDEREISFAFRVDDPRSPRCLVNVGVSQKKQ